MTILSKKKAIQGKSEVESSDATPHHNGSHSHGIALGSLPSHSQVCKEFMYWLHIILIPGCLFILVTL